MLKKMVLACMLVGVAVSASAKDDGPYLLFSLGQAKLATNATSLSELGLTASNERSSAWKLGLGYSLNKTSAIEVGYINEGALKLTQESPTRLNRDAKLKAMFVSLVGRVEVAPQTNLIGKLGVARHQSTSLARSLDGSKVSPLIGTGVEYLLSDNAAVVLEYDYLGKTKATDAVSYIGVGARLGF